MTGFYCDTTQHCWACASLSFVHCDAIECGSEYNSNQGCTRCCDDPALQAHCGRSISSRCRGSPRPLRFHHALCCNVDCTKNVVGCLCVDECCTCYEAQAGYLPPNPFSVSSSPQRARPLAATPALRTATFRSSTKAKSTGTALALVNTTINCGVGRLPTSKLTASGATALLMTRHAVRLFIYYFYSCGAFIPTEC